MSLNKAEDKIRASLIIDVIGKPPEHLTATLEEFVKKIGEEKGVSLINKKISPPVIIKEQKDFYSSFAEIEIGLEEIFSLAILVFKYMPAHIEVTSPEKFSVSNTDWNDILNEVTRRLHGYDEVARVMQFQIAKMQEELKKKK